MIVAAYWPLQTTEIVKTAVVDQQVSVDVVSTNAPNHTQTGKEEKE